MKYTIFLRKGQPPLQPQPEVQSSPVDPMHGHLSVCIFRSQIARADCYPLPEFLNGLMPPAGIYVYHVPLM